MSLLWTLCIVAVVGIALVSVLGGDSTSSKALEQRLARRRTAMEAAEEPVAPVTPIAPEAPGRSAAPVRDDEAA